MPITPVRVRGTPEWDALDAHFAKLRDVHLRDLFAEDPLIFKKLIYEMRFDRVSAVYALFGAFYVGVRVPAGGLAELLRV